MSGKRARLQRRQPPQPVGYLSGARVTPATDSGWATYNAGSRLSVAGATNLCTDPQGTLADGTFWPADTANTNTTANQALPVPLPSEPTIAKCLKLVNDGTADAPVTADITVSASVAYNSSVYVYAPALGGNLTISVETGHSFSLAALTGTNATWVRYSVQSNTVAGEVVLGLKFTFAGGTASTVYVTGFCPVASTVLTPYFDGTYPACAWTGTAHASTSTRTGAILNHAPPAATLGQTGTFAMKFVPLFPSTVTAITPVLMGIFDGTNTARAALAIQTPCSYIRMTVGAYSQSAAGAYAIGDSIRLVGRWNAAGVYLNRNGTDATAGAPPTVGGACSRFGLAGRTATADTIAYSPTGYTACAIRSDACKSDAWVNAIQANSGAAFNNPTLLWNAFMEEGDVLYPLGVNGLGWRKVRGTPPFPSTGLIVFDGDSLTAGSGATPGVTDYPTQTINLLGIGWDKVNEAVGGQTSQQAIDAAATVDARYNATVYTTNILCIWIGENDATAEITETNLPTYCAARQATGWQVVVLTHLPSSGTEAKAIAVNTWMRANWATWADALADTAADARIGDSEAIHDTTYYVDQVHLTVAGYAIVAGIVKTAIEGLL